MKQNNLLHLPYGQRPTRVHDGKIITIKSNLRWCSDGFTIPCENGDRVNVACAMDCCDRKIIGYIATSIGGIDSDMICDLIANCFIYSFGNCDKLPAPIPMANR